jgi:ACS family glucarate transporter-like MFS transporter
MNLQTNVALERPTNVRYVVLAWACSLSMITYIDRVCISRVAGDMTRDLGLTSQQMGWIFSAFALAYAAFEVPSGWLGDKFGPRLVLCRIVLWWSLFTALTGLVYPFSWDLGWFTFNAFGLLLIIRFLFGAGEAGAYPNIARALRNWFPYSRRGMAQGLLWMFGRWGGALAPLLIAFIAGGADVAFSLGLGWRAAFIVFGAVGALWVVAFAIFFRDHPDQHAKVNEAERAYIRGSVPEPVKPPPMSWSTTLSSPTLWCLSLMYFCSNAGWYFFITWHVEYYRTVLGLEGRDLSIAAGAPLFFGGIACLGGGFITDWMVRLLGRRWGRTAQGAIAYFCGGAFFTAALFAYETPWLAVACLCMASFVKDFAISASWSTCIDIGHRYSGTVAGFMNMVGNLGGVVSPPILVWLAEPPGQPTRWDVALVYSATMFFIAAVAWLFINPKHVIVYGPEASGAA